jgi:hypothetical protein
MKVNAELDTFTADQLDVKFDQLRSIQSQIRAVEVALLREVDRRQIPLGDGMPSLESWAVGRLDIDPATARRLIAVARADSAELDRQLVEDGLSFDRVSELARAGTTDPHLHLDMVGLKRSLRARDRLKVVDEREAFERRFVSIQPSLDESSWKLWGLLPALEGKTVAGTLDAVADELPREPHAESRSARRADALFMVCDRQGGDGSSSGLVNTTVVVDAREAAEANGETGSWIVGGPRVGPGTLERLLCESTVEVIARNFDGEPLAVGTASTSISPRTRRWVLARDGGFCTADGCGSSYRLQPHHVRHRNDGGDNEASNLTSLCWFHHHVVVHGRGFQIDPTSPQLRRRFLPPKVVGSDPP